MTLIVHLSDTHFGTEIPAVVTALQQAVNGLRPDVAILSGDITQRARPAQFEAAAAFMQALPVAARLVIPGNHDIPLYNLAARFLTPYRNYARAFGARQTVWTQNKLAVLGYDATSPLRHTRGQLRRGRVLAQLAALRGAQGPSGVLLACAHQPLVTAWPQDAHETLIGRVRTAELFAQGDVDIVLSGHVHVPLLTTTREAFGGLKRHFILAGAGTAVSHRVRPGAPNSFNAIRVDDGRIGVALHEYDGSRFVCAGWREFEKAGDGWRPCA